MTKFTIHTPETAPEITRPWLREIKQSLGFLPNMLAGLAESPTALKSHQVLADLFAKSRLTPIEQQVVALSVSIDNDCEYCVAAHTVIANNAARVPAPIVDALRNGGKLPDSKLDALATFTRQVIRKRGRLEDSDVKAFIDAGYDRGQVLDVLLGISMKTMSNYANQIMGVPLDKEYESGRWSRERKAA